MLSSEHLAIATNALTSLLYSGEWTNPNGTQYLRARFYDPTTGRFNRLDPFAGNQNDPQSLHKYLYTHGNPTMGIDPSGMMSLKSVGISTLIASSLIGLTVPVLSGAIAYAAGGPNKSASDFWGGFVNGIPGGLAVTVISIEHGGPRSAAFWKEIGKITYQAVWGTIFDLISYEVQSYVDQSKKWEPTTWSVVNELFWDNFTSMSIASAMKFIKSDDVKYAAALSFAETMVRKSGDVVESIFTNAINYFDDLPTDWEKTANLFGELVFDATFASAKTAVNSWSGLDEAALKETTKQVIWGGWRVLLSNV